MLDISHTLVHKLTLHITRKPNSSSDISTIDAVKGILCDRIAELWNLSVDWHVFANGGRFASLDETVKVQTASLNASGFASLWAMYINVKDADLSRRRWVYYLGLRTEDDDSVTFYYAKCCYDHMAGSISECRPIPLQRDAFPDPLFYSAYIQCMCGKHPLPEEPQILNHSTLPMFIELLQDEERTQPLFLITCPWYLSPEMLFDFIMGNAIIFWCEDSSVVMRLNAMLPGSMYTWWDSARIFMPLTAEKAFHPQYTYEEIHRMGRDNFIDGILQAYCQSMRAEERRNFVTLNDVFLTKSKAINNAILAEKQALEERIAVQDAALEQQKKKFEALQEQMTQLSSSPKPIDTDEYEALLEESMNETDSLKQGIIQLTARLCSDMGRTFKPDPNESIALLQELSNSIYACLKCVRSAR